VVKAPLEPPLAILWSAVSAAVAEKVVANVAQPAEDWDIIKDILNDF